MEPKVRRYFNWKGLAEVIVSTLVVDLITAIAVGYGELNISGAADVISLMMILGVVFVAITLAFPKLPLTPKSISFEAKVIVAIYYVTAMIVAVTWSSWLPPTFKLLGIK